MIVKSILDTDLYKFTTSYAYMKLFPQAKGTFEFFDRDDTEYPDDFIEKLYLELSSLGMLRLTRDAALSNYQIGENLDMDIEELDTSRFTELKSYTY